MFAYLKNFCRDENAASAFEYALFAGLIGLGVVSALSAFSNKLSSSFSNVSSVLK